MSFPLYSHEKDKLISMDGRESFFFEYFPPDLEQRSDLDREQSLNLLENDLRLHDFGDFLRVYSLSAGTFLNCPKRPSLGEARVRTHESPLKTFFGGDLNSDIDFYGNYFAEGTRYMRIVSLKSPPSMIGENGIERFKDGDMDLIINLQRVPSHQAKRRLDLKRRMHFSGLFKEMKDHESENAFNEAEEMLESVTTSEIALFRTECLFLLRADSLEELNAKTEKLLDRLKTMDATGFIETNAQSYLFKSLVPGVPPNFLRGFDTPSTYLKNMIPFHRDKLMEEGTCFSARSGEGLRFNLFDPSAHNYNLLITGSSGQGKSMVVGKLIKEELGEKSKVVCLDLGNSFRKNALYHEASIFSEKFNPLQFRNPRYLKEFILACVDEKFSKKEEGRLFEAIQSVLQQGVQSFEELIFSLEKDFPGLKYYFSEIQDFFTNKTKAQRDFTYCDISNFPESIKAPLVIFLIEYFKNLEGRKIFVFDECWSLLERNAEYIAECFRTFRKHSASAVAISQNLDDFSETQLGRVIIQNTFFKFFFRSDLSKSEFVSDHLAGKVKEAQTVKGKYSEFIVSSEDLCKPTRFYPTELEYELFSSDGNDCSQFENYMREKGKFLDFPRAIENYTQIKYPHWRPDATNT